MEIPDWLWFCGAGGAICLLVFCVLVEITAVDGYEDEEGFHRGEK